MELLLVSHGEEQTEALGRHLGQLMQPGDVLALVGDLGVGKTCLARGIARGLGITDPVTSPTFILVAEYDTADGFPLYHADCYRFDDAPAEALGIGLDELMDGAGACVIEWAERITDLLPADHLRIELTAVEADTRHLRFLPAGPRAQQLVAQLRSIIQPSGYSNLHHASCS